MTDPTARTRPVAPASSASRRPPIRKPGSFPVVAGALGLFFAVAALLAFQLRAGRDPAIGAGPSKPAVAAVRPEPRKVLVRRVIVTRIVEHRRREPAPSAAPPSAAPAPSAPAAPAPAAPAAPAPSAPAPAPAAPAPAPITTQSS